MRYNYVRADITMIFFTFLDNYIALPELGVYRLGGLDRQHRLSWPSSPNPDYMAQLSKIKVFKCPAIFLHSHLNSTEHT